MKTVKKVLIFVLVMVMMFSMVACTANNNPSETKTVSPSETKTENSAPSESTKPDYATLRVGTLPFTGSVPFAYATQQGYFEEAGLNIEQYEFPTGAPMNEAFAAGQLDIAIIGLAGVISMSKGDAVCIYETNTASGGNGIYVRPDSPLAQASGQVNDYPNLKGSADLLEGITIIGQLATASQLMTIMYLEKFGLTQDDINFVNMDTGSDYQAFKTGEGDAVALMTPYTYQARDDGYVEIASFEDAADFVIPDTMLATKDIMASDRETVKAFLQVYMRAIDELNADPNMLFETSKQYFIDCGREYADEYITADLETRFPIDVDYMSQSDYVFGAGMWQVANLFVEAGKIDEANLHNVVDCLDTSLIEELTGLTVKVQTAG